MSNVGPYTSADWQEDRMLIGRLVGAKRYGDALKYAQDLFVALDGDRAQQLAGMLFILDLLRNVEPITETFTITSAEQSPASDIFYDG